MFNLFGDSTFGQAANQALNTGIGDSPVGSLAEYMNNIYGNGKNLNMKGVKMDDQGMMPPQPLQLQTKDASQGLSTLMQGTSPGGQPTGMSPEQGMQAASMLLALL